MDDARPNPRPGNPDRPVFQPLIIGRVVAPLIRLIALYLTAELPHLPYIVRIMLDQPKLTIENFD